MEGWAVVSKVGNKLGLLLDGSKEGTCDGINIGLVVGNVVGKELGLKLGVSDDGSQDGVVVLGQMEGSSDDGCMVGEFVDVNGIAVGVLVSLKVGFDGKSVAGRLVALGVGSEVGGVVI